MAGKQWVLLNEGEPYLLAYQDDRPYETDLQGYGRVFLHQFGTADDRLLYTQVITSPQGDKLTADFTGLLLASEQLGRDSVPDFLSG